MPVIDNMDKLKHLVHYFGLDPTRMATTADPKDVQPWRSIDKWAPGLWRRINTKHIESPGSHHSYQSFMKQICDAIIEHYQTDLYGRGGDASPLKPKDTGPNRIIAMASSIMAQYNFPAYFVSRSLLIALRRTTPPDQTWNDLSFPFPGAVYMMPKGFIHDHEGEEVTHIGYGIIRGGVDIANVGMPGRIFQCTTDSIYIFWYFDSSRCGCMNSRMDLKFLSTASRIIENKDLSTLEETTTPEDYAAFITPLLNMLVNLILVQSARPEIVEKSEPTKQRLKSGLQCYSPAFIGRKYEIKYEHPGGPKGGHFTEMRWRAGHYRMQHYGTGRVNVKTIWIDPYIAHSAGLVREESDGK